MGMPSWSEEHLQILKDNWPTRTSGEIAEMVGKSRGAVMGMKRRLGLESKKPSGNQHPPNPNPGRKRYTSTIRKLRPRPEPQAPVPLMDARIDQCRAVIDGIKDKDGLAMVCGKPIVFGQAFSFCSEHLQQYTTKGGYYVRGYPINK